MQAGEPHWNFPETYGWERQGGRGVYGCYAAGVLIEWCDG